MTETLTPYPEYRDSGAAWLGRVPAHWEVHPNRALFAEVKDQGHENEPMLSVTISRGIVTQERLLAGSSKKDSSNLDRSRYKLVQPGDIAYNKMRAWQGALGVSRHRGIVSPAYVVVRPRREMDPNYYHHLMRTAGFAEEAGRWSYGITSDMWSLRYEDFKQIAGILPPIEEQRQIGRYLDAQSARVDRLIRVKQRLVALLTEQKQAVIHRAVTRGLDPDAPMKPSGVDWLGDVPAHWDVWKLKHAAERIVGGATPSSGNPSFWNGDIVWATPRDVSRTDELHDSERHLTRAGFEACSAVMVPAGSVVVTSRAPVGNVALASVDLCLNQGCKAVVPLRKKLNSRFAFYVFMSAQSEMQNRSTGTTFMEVSTWKVANIEVALPPLVEQRKIVERLDFDLEALREAMEAAHREIALIREYRTRLVADVVTGKLDVRGASVPDLAEALLEPTEALDEEIAEDA